MNIYIYIYIYKLPLYRDFYMYTPFSMYGCTYTCTQLFIYIPLYICTCVQRSTNVWIHKMEWIWLREEMEKTSTLNEIAWTWCRWRLIGYVFSLLQDMLGPVSWKCWFSVWRAGSSLIYTCHGQNPQQILWFSACSNGIGMEWNGMDWTQITWNCSTRMHAFFLDPKERKWIDCNVKFRMHQ